MNTAQRKQKEKQNDDPREVIYPFGRYGIQQQDGQANEYGVNVNQVLGVRAVLGNQFLGKFLTSEYNEAKRKRKMVMIIKTG